MPDFLIRDLDEDTMRQLRERAEKNGRSLQAEIKDVLRQSTRLGKAESLKLIRKMQDELRGRDMGEDSTVTIRKWRDGH